MQNFFRRTPFTNYTAGLIWGYAIGPDKLPSLIKFLFKVRLVIFNGRAAVFTVIRKDTLTPFMSGLIAIITCKPIICITSPIKTENSPAFDSMK